MSNLVKQLRCFNPLSGKNDGQYCMWEGVGKCLKCQAADRIEELEANAKKDARTIKQLTDVIQELEVKLAINAKANWCNVCTVNVALTKAEKQVERLELNIKTAYDKRDAAKQGWAEALERIERLKALPQRWRDNAEVIYSGYPATVHRCANELEAAIKGDDDEKM